MDDVDVSFLVILVFAGIIWGIAAWEDDNKAGYDEGNGFAIILMVIVFFIAPAIIAFITWLD